MAHCSIGQERFGFAGGPRSASSLDKLERLIDWDPVSVLLDPLYSATKGEPAWPPLAMFKARLLSIWHALSDVKLAEAFDDRTYFRRFCGFSGAKRRLSGQRSCAFAMSWSPKNWIGYGSSL